MSYVVYERFGTIFVYRKHMYRQLTPVFYNLLYLFSNTAHALYLAVDPTPTCFSYNFWVFSSSAFFRLPSSATNGFYVSSHSSCLLEYRFSFFGVFSNLFAVHALNLATDFWTLVICFVTQIALKTSRVCTSVVRNYVKD